MDKKIEEIDNKIMQLKEEKEKVKKESSIRKNKEKRDNISNNHVNKIVRISSNFDDEIIDVQNKRIENGIDETSMSKPKITELIIKHKSWSMLKADLINYNLEGDEENNE